MSIILTETGIIDASINVILALFGKLPKGAGYVSVISSSFMGALSGSGPGNVMATGSITIPAMKKSGFPAELAANIESNASYLGNMIPPSGNIVAALGALIGMAACFSTHRKLKKNINLNKTTTSIWRPFFCQNLVLTEL